MYTANRTPHLSQSHAFVCESLCHGMVRLNFTPKSDISGEDDFRQRDKSALPQPAYPPPDLTSRHIRPHISAMPTHSRDESKAEKKAAAKAALARARQWSEERRGKSLVATTSKVYEPSSKKDAPANKPAQKPVEVAPDIHYRKTEKRAQALARAREWNSERKNMNSKAAVPATIETKLGKAHKIDAEDLSDCADDFKTSDTTDRAHEDRPARTDVVMPKALVKELISIENDMKKMHKRLDEILSGIMMHKDSAKELISIKNGMNEMHKRLDEILCEKHADSDASIMDLD
jgi:tetrahydromethanopterin S-methyltransferase subunit G